MGGWLGGGEWNEIGGWLGEGDAQRELNRCMDGVGMRTG